MHTYTCIYISIHTYAQYMCIYLQCTNSDIHTPTHMYRYIYRLMHIQINMLMHLHLRIHTNIHRHPCTCAYIPTCTPCRATPRHRHASLATHIHTHMQSYIQTCTYIDMCSHTHTGVQTDKVNT